jgi:hypothetical protein
MYRLFRLHQPDGTMDLSGLNPANPSDQPRATVLATYSLRNDGVVRGIDLVFVTASQSVRAHVSYRPGPWPAFDDDELPGSAHSQQRRRRG